MRLRILMLWSLMFCMGCSSCGQKSPKTEKLSKYDPVYYQAFPKYDKVVETYFRNYPDQVGVNNYEFKFEKREKGWFVVNFDKKDATQLISSTLFWSAEEKQYLGLTGDSSQILDPKALLFHQQTPQKRYYNQCPLCGYEKSNLDLIELLGKKKKLSNQDLECLARAYSREATRMLVPRQSGQRFDQFDSTLTKGSYDEKYLKTYKKMVNNALKTYQRLREQYIHYKTSVGSIQIKYPNEHVAHYYEAMIIGEEEMAAEFLQDNLYNTATLEIAKNYLRSCQPNAILFTVGDNDTYPLLYVQEKQNFRKDVTIINSSLANLGRYINYITTTDKNIKRGFSIETYRLDNNDYLIVKQNKKPIYFHMYVKDLQKNPERYIVKEYTTAEKTVHAIPTHTINITRDVKPIDIHITNKILLKSDLFVLDIINSNFPDRPIHFTLGYPRNKLWDLGSYLRTEGYTYRLSKELKEQFYSIDVEHLADNIYKKLAYPTLSGAESTYEEFKYNNTLMLLAINSLAEHYERTFQTDSLDLLLDWTHSKFPIKAIHYQAQHLSFAKYCLRTQDQENAITHFEVYAKRLEEDFLKLDERYADDAIQHYQEKRFLQNGMQILLSSVQKIGMIELENVLRTQLEPYLEKE
ncbi:MAG: hypothetical protein MK212_04655 [Saprospiraceae bacterium]|nr:hypothetical protein [Saprospiraceae bacterium]